MPKTGQAVFFFEMASKQPDTVIQRREAAMDLIDYVAPEDRILLLGYVTGLVPVSMELLRLEAEEDAA